MPRFSRENLPFGEVDKAWSLYLSSYLMVRGLERVLLGMKVYGQANIPKEGRALVAANHRHWLDIFMLPTAIPKRHLSIVAKKEVYDTPIMGTLFSKWESIPVNRENPGPSTMKEVVRRLKDDRLVGVMPEGTRRQNSELGEMFPGVARWAYLGDAPTIPAAIRGVDTFGQAVRGHRAEVVFGEPIDPPSSKDDEPAFMQFLRSEIQKLVNLKY
ncbi:MAG TPA: lysophospholipid acyltransferase family protein [Candidatus Saccharimonadales bacterium]|nr:lysophospholipid acyltransferase family protein [Candidatus Saccharimonadales bacterium]